MFKLQYFKNKTQYIQFTLTITNNVYNIAIQRNNNNDYNALNNALNVKIMKKKKNRKQCL